jgi:hypothetical protein
MRGIWERFGLECVTTVTLNSNCDAPTNSKYDACRHAISAGATHFGASRNQYPCENFWSESSAGHSVVVGSASCRIRGCTPKIGNVAGADDGLGAGAKGLLPCLRDVPDPDRIT